MGDCAAELIAGCWGKGSSVSCKNTVPLVAWQKGFAKIKGLYKAGRYMVQIDVGFGNRRA